MKPLLPTSLLAVLVSLTCALGSSVRVGPSPGSPLGETHAEDILAGESENRRGMSPDATTDDISVSGFDPTTVALSWDESGDWCFTNYEIQYSLSGSDGPWTTVDTITSAGVTSLYWNAFSPGETVWFQDVDNSGCGGGSATSNVVDVTFPAAASVSYRDTGESTVELAWNNNADYGGLLTFDSYQVEESINGAGFTTVATVTTESALQYSVAGVTGLTTGTTYQFRIVTTDECSGCSGGSYPASSNSNTLTHLTLDVPTATPSSLGVGSDLALSVTVVGGTGSYSFDWTGLPAGCSPADRAQIECAPTASGTYSVTVTVTDSDGSTLTSMPVTVSVTQASGGGLLGGGGSTSSGSVGTYGWWIVAILVVLAIIGTAAVLIARRSRAGLATANNEQEAGSSATESTLAMTSESVRPQFCATCGGALPAGNQYCSRCGAVWTRSVDPESPHQT